MVGDRSNKDAGKMLNSTCRVLKIPDALKASRIKAIHGEGVGLGRVREERDNIGARPLILPASVNEEQGRGKVEGFHSFPTPPLQFFSRRLPRNFYFLLPKQEAC